MTRHYTYAHQYGNQIFVRGYDDLKGGYFTEKIPFKPTMYLPSRVPTDYTTLDGQYVAPVQPGNIRDTKEFISQYSNVSGTAVYGMERFVYQYLSEEYAGEVDYDVELVRESSKAAAHTVDLFLLPKVIHAIEQLVDSPLTHYQLVTLQKFTASLFQCTAFQLHNMYTNTGVNKQMYIADKMSCHMLKLAAKFGCVSDMLYIAMYYYKTLRYREALSVIEMTKVKLAQPYLMYRHVDRERYTEAVGGQSWSTKMRQAVAQDIRLDNRICYISELIPEQQSALQNKLPLLYIPVFVMLHFLEFLCYRHIDTTLSQAALDELQVLVHHDQGLYILDLFRDISWEILGICQQITGNLQAALYSYQQSLSLSHYPFNSIRTATQRRIQDVVETINELYK